MKLHFDTILFGKSSNSIGDMQPFLLGFCSNFVLGRCPIGKVRNDQHVIHCTVYTVHALQFTVGCTVRYTSV